MCFEDVNWTDMAEHTTGFCELGDEPLGSVTPENSISNK